MLVPDEDVEFNGFAFCVEDGGCCGAVGCDGWGIPNAENNDGGITFSISEKIDVDSIDIIFFSLNLPLLLLLLMVLGLLLLLLIFCP